MTYILHYYITQNVCLSTAAAKYILIRYECTNCTKVNTNLSNNDEIKQRVFIFIMIYSTIEVVALVVLEVR